MCLKNRFQKLKNDIIKERTEVQNAMKHLSEEHPMRYYWFPIFVIGIALLAFSFAFFAECLGLSHWDWVAFVISVAALGISWYAAKYQYKSFASQEATERNTKKMTSDQQVQLLNAMIRHLYRNLVVTCAMIVKLNRDSSKKPSIEHLTKLHVEVSDVIPEAFVNDGDVLGKLKELQLKMRNYNIEIDTAAQYFMTPGMRKEAIDHIMDTLLVKPGLLTADICEIVTNQFGRNDAYKVAFDTVEESHKKQAEKSLDREHPELAEEERVTAKQVLQYCDPQKGVFKNNIDKFLSMLNEDVRNECGKNDTGNDIIFFI